jgi:hypothetical protein
MPFPFLQLPGELRNMIYELVLCSQLNMQPVSPKGNVLIEAPRLFGRNAFAPPEPPHNIFSVCRQVRQETRSHYYSRHGFTLYPCSLDHKPMFRRWIKSLDNDSVRRFSRLIFVEELFLVHRRVSVNGVRTPRFTTRKNWDMHSGNQLPFLLTVRLDLSTVPPTVIVRVAREAKKLEGSEAAAIVARLRRRSIPRMDRVSRSVAKRTGGKVRRELEVRLTGAFGGLRKTGYEMHDLEELLDIFQGVVMTYFGENGERNRRYWLRERNGTTSNTT